MPLRNTDTRYGAVAQVLHWLIALLLIAQFSLGFMAHDLPLSLERLKLLSRHKALGMTILALVLLRLLWRWMTPPPPLPASMPAREQQLARISHRLLYLLLLTLPVVGWVSSSAANLSVSWFGWFTFPDLVAPDKQLADTAKAIHGVLAGLLLGLICLHVAAALRHHFVLRDDVLRRMLPVRGESSRDEERP